MTNRIEGGKLTQEMLVHTNLEKNINKLVQTCAGEAESSLVHTKNVNVLFAMQVRKNNHLTTTWT